MATIDVDADIRVSCGVTALSFDGVDDYVSRNAIPMSGYPFSIYIRARVDNTDAAWIFAMNNASSNNHYLGIAEETDKFTYQIRGSGNNVNNTGWFRIESSVTVDNEWHDFVLISESSNVHKFYIDGVLEGTSSVSVTFPSGLNRTFLGKWNRQNSANFSGCSISEFAVWDSILSAPDIATLDSNFVGISQIVDAANLQVQWNLNGFGVGVSADGETITDNSGNSFDGTGNDGANNTGLVGINTMLCLQDLSTLVDVDTDIRIKHTEVITDLDADIRGLIENKLDLNLDIRAKHIEVITDVDVDIRGLVENIIDVDTDIRAKFTEVITDLNTDIRALKPSLTDINIDIRGLNENSEDINCDIRARVAAFVDVNCDIRGIIFNFKDINCDIRVSQRPNNTQVIINSITFSEGIFHCDNNVTILMDVDGAIKMQFRRENEVSFSALEIFANTKTLTLSPGDGNKSVFIKFQDIKGKITDEIQIDVLINSSTPPGVSIEAYEDETASVAILDSIAQNDINPFFRWNIPVFNIPYSGFSVALDSVPDDLVNVDIPNMVREGLEVAKATPLPEMTLDIASGFFYAEGILSEVTASTVLLSDGGGDDRIDLIYMDGFEHTVKIVEGIEDVSPIAPSLPEANSPIILAEVLVPAGTVLIADVTIEDKRVTFINLNNYIDSTLSAGTHTLQIKSITQCDSISNIDTFNISIANQNPDMGEILGYKDGTKVIEIFSNIYQTGSDTIFLEWTASPNEPGPITYYYTIDGSEPTLASSSTVSTTLNLGSFPVGFTTIKIKPFDDTTGNSGRTLEFIFVFGATSSIGETLVIGGGVTLKQSLKQVQVKDISWDFDSARICRIFQPVDFDSNLPFDLADNISVVHNDVTLFAGKVKKIERTITVGGEGVTYVCTGPRGILTECFAVIQGSDGIDTAVINFENTPLQEAITSITSTVPGIIKNVQSLPIGTDIIDNFQGQTVEQVLSNLYLKTKYGWYIKPDGTLVSVASDIVNPNQAKFGVYGTTVNAISPQYNVMSSNLQFDITKRYNRAIIEGSNKEVLRTFNLKCLASEKINGPYIRKEDDFQKADFTKYKVISEFNVTKVIETRVSYKKLLGAIGWATPFGGPHQTGTAYIFTNYESVDNNKIIKVTRTGGLFTGIQTTSFSSDEIFPQGNLAADNIISFAREVANIWFVSGIKSNEFGVETSVGDFTAKYCGRVSADVLIETQPLVAEISVSGTADSLGSKTLRLVNKSFKYSEDPDNPIDDTQKMKDFAADKLASLKDVKVNGSITLDTIDTSWTLDNTVNLINTAQGSWTSLNAKVVGISYNFDENTTTIELTSEFLK